MNLNAMLFTDTLALIKDDKLRNFTKLAIAELPNYFFEIPASSSGKYHSEADRTYGGLVHHTKACCHVAYDLFRSNPFNITERELDLALVALHLHDSLKNGSNEDCGYTVAEHPLLSSHFVRNLSVPDEFDLSIPEKNIVCGCLESHTGKWNTDRTGKEILPLPKTDLEKFVHLVDYISSRVFIDIDIKKVK